MYRRIGNTTIIFIIISIILHYYSYELNRVIGDNVCSVTDKHACNIAIICPFTLLSLTKNAIKYIALVINLNSKHHKTKDIF